jgi:hypothetical protein
MRMDRNGDGDVDGKLDTLCLYYLEQVCPIDSEHLVLHFFHFFSSWFFDLLTRERRPFRV